MKDKIDRSIIGSIGGLIGGLAFTIFLHISGLFISGSYTKVLHIAHLFIPVSLVHKTTGGFIIANIAHIILSSLLGILFINFFRITGRDWVTTKGIIFGATAWVIIYGIMGKLLNLPMEGRISVAYAQILAHIIFGIVTAWSVFWLSEKYKL